MSSNNSATEFSPDHPLHPVSLKIKRSERHISEVEATIASFFRRNPYSVAKDIDPEDGSDIWRLEINEPIPGCLSCMIGDAIHNIRAAFDLIACQIVSIDSNNITQTYFPINMKRESFITKGLRKIKGAPKNDIDVVEWLQPYQGGHNLPLWHIHKLDIMDKHRSIIPVGAATKSGMLDLSIPATEFFPLSSGLKLSMEPERICPLEDGAILMRALSETVFNTTSATTGPIDKNAQFTFDISFGEGEVASCEPVVPTLRQFSQFASEAVAIFRDEVFS